LWVGIVLASLALLIVLVLIVPLDGVWRVDIYGRPRFSMRLAWLFGLLSKEVEKREKKAVEEKEAPEGKPRPTKKMTASNIFRVLRTKGLLKQVLTFLKDILSCLRFKRLEADLTVGFDNPADTGLLFAFIGPALLFLRPTPPYQIRVQPSFDPTCQGYLSGTIRLQPIQLVPPLLKFTFSLPTIRAIKTLVLTRWKRRR
jgi:hypothetical protein